MRRAAPSSSISSPAKGSTGQNPRKVRKPAMPKHGAHAVRKKTTAPRALSEQFGAITIQACADSNCGTSGGLEYGARRTCYRVILFIQDNRLRARPNQRSELAGRQSQQR